MSASHKMTRLPLHPLFFAAFPVLSLLAHNLVEVETDSGVRALIVSLAVAAAATAVLGLLLRRDWTSAAVWVTCALILFFSYGQIYAALKSTVVLGVTLGRHRVLGPGLVAVAIGGFYLLRRAKDLHGTTLILNLTGLVLVVIPMVQISDRTYRSWRAQRLMADQASTLLQPAAGEPLPDVYVLVLDTYMRADALQREFGFDNTPFVGELEALGFYVATCSRSNYDYTQASLAALLNMEYLPGLFALLEEKRLANADVWYLIRHSVVRQELEQLGYRVFAFDSGYDWSRMVDADVYLSPRRVSPLIGTISPFEALLLRTTAASIVLDASTIANANRVGGIVYPYGRHIALEEFILDQLPRVVAGPGPKFVFAHLLMPHVPYVFAEDGSIRTDPGFYSGPESEPIDETYRRLGYTGEATYLNRRVLEFAQAALRGSDVQPIIVIVGDHGLRDDSRLQNLGAYLVPDSAVPDFRPSITPVNVFRTIFDASFGASLGQLPDQSFRGEAYSSPVEETAAECQVP